MNWLILACRLLVGGTYCYAALDKLQNPDAFAVVIHNYHMVPMSLLHGMAHVLPVIEMLIGLALIVGWQRRGAALLAALLTVIFIVAISSALLRGLDISCGCFNTDNGHAVGLNLLFRDFLLLIACVPPLLSRRFGWEIDRLFSR